MKLKLNPSIFYQIRTFLIVLHYNFQSTNLIVNKLAPNKLHLNLLYSLGNTCTLISF